MEEDIKEIEIIIETIRNVLQEEIKDTTEDVYTIDGRQFKALENLLTRYKKQQAELERLKKYEDLEWQEFNELSVANAEIKKKDGIINLMATYIGEEDITEKFCDEKTMCDEGCAKCVIEYFTNKVEREGK